MILESARPAGDRWLVRFEGIRTPEAARELCRGAVLAESGSFQRPEADFIFDHEIEGFRCLDRAGLSLGVARRLERYGPVPTLVVFACSGEVLIPFAYPIVVEIRPEAREIILDPPDGLLASEAGT